MKRTSMILALVFSIAIYSQNDFPSSGNTKIQDANLLIETSQWRSSLLTLKDTHYNPDQLYHFQVESDGLKIKQDGNLNYQFKSGGNFIVNNGKVGIGTTNPTAKLDVRGVIRSSHNTGHDIAFFVSGDGNSYLNFTGGSSSSRIGFQVDGSSKMSIYNNGGVSIGSGNPGSYKLAVNGSIRAKEVKVETGWADYVFREGYDLPTLEEVEKHIQEKGHLINIPSAKEVEENGIQLGEMNKLLLEKIEELTLYTLQQQEEIDTYQKGITLLNKKMEAMEQQINNLKN